MPIVHLRDVRLALGRTPILTGVDLTLEEGERLGVSGPNGAGKSTLLSVVATLRAPTAGGGRVLDAELGTDQVFTVRRRIGWTGHEPALYDELTLTENLRHLARLAGLEAGRADQVLEEVGLAGAAGRRAAACSNGMRRRADLARLLMLRPRLVLLDEAHAGLDADAAIIIEAIARRTVEKGGGVVMVSHDAGALGDHVDRVVTLNDGRTVDR
jgi:heme exporter protein A